MSEFFRPNIARMRGYVPGEQPQEGGYIKLNTNENPYPPSPLALERLRTALDDRLRLYPDPNAHALRHKLAEVFTINPDQIIVGNGSDELLNIIIRSFAGEDDKIVYHKKQNVQPVVEHCKNLSEQQPGKEFRHVAEIPMVIYQRMVRDGSINDKQALKKWLNDPDNQAFRTWKGKV